MSFLQNTLSEVNFPAPGFVRATAARSYPRIFRTEKAISRQWLGGCAKILICGAPVETGKE
jgi:hypothetical protein